MPLKVSVIIVNYNAGPELSNCVKSIAHAREDLEILVVDNDSYDGSLETVKNSYQGDKKLTILQNKENLGFAVASNQGSRIAKGDYLFYLNPDCVINPDTISKLIQCLQSNKKCGMAGGLILNPDGTEQRGCRRSVPTPWRSLVNSFGLKRLARVNRKFFSDFRLDQEPLPEKAIEVEAISGACMLVSKEAFVNVGPMDEGYFLHCEDLDWCMQFRQRGWKIMFVPQARLVHSKGSCSSSRPVFVEWSKHKGMVRFYRKFFADQYPGLMFWLVWLGIWLRFTLSLVRILFRKLLNIGQKGD